MRDKLMEALQELQRRVWSAMGALERGEPQEAASELGAARETLESTVEELKEAS